jgi:hypothetical protein
MSEEASKAGPLYVYGLAATGALAPDAALGEGVEAAAVRLFAEGRLSALVSPLAPDPAAGGQVAQTRRNMIAHTAVLERAMAGVAKPGVAKPGVAKLGVTVLPVRFGTVAPDAAALARCIAGNATALGEALAEIDGRVELGVKARWREGVVYEEILAGNAALRELRDRLRGRPAGETYYERVELGRRVEAALAERRAAETAAILADLARLAERELPLRAVEEDMILNHAFLVRRDQEARFDAQVQSLADRCGGRISLRYVGPVPPYNFVRLRADWLAAA